MVPHLIDRVLDSKQNIIYGSNPEIWLNPLSGIEAEKVIGGLILAVNKNRFSVGIAGVQIATKSGSPNREEIRKTNAGILLICSA
jgi:peptidoglycan glycosyltransferase